jgi:hypothetical protein
MPRRLLAAALIVAATALPARAEMDKVAPVTDPTVKKECGACHLAYSPQFLSAQTWTALIADLPHHFGEDAGLPDAPRAAVLAYYTQFAGHSQPGLKRISEQSWWLREHRAVGQAKFAAAKSKANCGACHSHADEGEFEN